MSDDDNDDPLPPMRPFFKCRTPTENCKSVEPLARCRNTLDAPSLISKARSRQKSRSKRSSHLRPYSIPSQFSDPDQDLEAFPLHLKNIPWVRKMLEQDPFWVPMPMSRSSGQLEKAWRAVVASKWYEELVVRWTGVSAQELFSGKDEKEEDKNQHEEERHIDENMISEVLQVEDDELFDIGPGKTPNECVEQEKAT